MDLEHFIDQLIIDKGFDSEEPEVRAQIKEDLTERIEDRMNAFVISNIKPEDLEEFEKILDEGSDEKTQGFIRSHISDFDEKAATELLTFKTMYLG